MSERSKQGISRRTFMGRMVYSSMLLGFSIPAIGKLTGQGNAESIRRFHICLQPQAMRENPDLKSLIKSAGVTDIWLAGFLYGRWYLTPDELLKEAKALTDYGFTVHVVNVPLGHPGSSIGLEEGDDLNTPPSHWKNACTVDGKYYSGTSIHPPAQIENIDAMKKIAGKGFDTVFLDDDFRLARSPGQIGGCFCDDCRKEFLELYGYGSTEWSILLDSVVNRKSNLILTNWVDYSCNILYDMFVRLQMAAPDLGVGIMVMYLGAEKAGIPLDRFRQVPFRVGELMFDDKSFGRIKGKTDELFSSLFHRRFARPDLAFSESTAYPADQLSAKNMAAKLHISLISDVRNTMFMSGLSPFPATHWPVLGPAMRKSAEYHALIAGHKPRGPLKHFWGWDSRLLGKDNPYSLFLALGIPFEVVAELPADGWVFLSDEDAKAVTEGRLKSVRPNLIARPQALADTTRYSHLDESLESLFSFKKRIAQDLNGIPYIQEDIPVVFSWYPTARAAILWNLTERSQDFTIRCDDRILHRISVNALDVELVRIFNT